jgi:hypothetical protein
MAHVLAKIGDPCNKVITTDGCDGIHFTKQNNIDLGKAIARKVQEILLPK